MWTDDEVELLLKVTLEYKVNQTAKNIDWESCQTKYSDILDLFLEQYPSPENAKMMEKDYSHKEEEITKVILTTKLEAIWQKFRLVGRVGTGRLSSFTLNLAKKYGVALLPL